jgi:hypothetical protein
MHYSVCVNPAQIFKSLFCFDNEAVHPALTQANDQRYLGIRANLVKFIMETGMRLNLQTKTIHLAVTFVDLFLAKRPNSHPFAFLYALTSLMLAGEFHRHHFLDFS